jgi:hypothetical protein
MKTLLTALTALTLALSAPARAQVNPSQYPVDPHALRYGKRCILKKGALVATNENALRDLFRFSHAHDLAGVRRLLARRQIDGMICDALAIPIQPYGLSHDVVEIRIPGYLRHVYTARAWLDGDVKGYLAAH